MALIAMACHDTVENKKSGMTEKTLTGLLSTVDFEKHRLFIIDNGSCQETKDIIEKFLSAFEDWISMHQEDSKAVRPVVYTLPKNIGTARAINIAWKNRAVREHCIKIDNDIFIEQAGWADQLEYAVLLDPLIGQVGLKRKDCWETPWHENKEHRSELHMLPHIPYQKWVIIEKVKHVIGSCVLHSTGLLDKVGYLYQPGLYGYDDVLMSWRSHIAGFYNCFLSHIEIFHIDPGGDEYCSWKEKHSGQYQRHISDIVDQYISGQRSIYYNE